MNMLFKFSFRQVESQFPFSCEHYWQLLKQENISPVQLKACFYFYLLNMYNTIIY